MHNLKPTIYIKNRFFYLDTLPTSSFEGNVQRVNQPSMNSELTDILARRLAEYRNTNSRLKEQLEAAYAQITDLEEKTKELEIQDKQLARLHKSSGMSTTLWKMTGSLDENKDKPQHMPRKSQDELMRECLYTKIMRVYPQLPKTHSNSREDEDKAAEPRENRAPLNVRLKHKTVLENKSIWWPRY